MKARWGLIVGLLAAVLVVVPLATAGAQAPPDTGDEVTEGSVPTGGTVNCSTAPTLDPDHGPPGTLVTVTASFQGNCDEFAATLFGLECIGQVTGDFEGFSFPFAFSDIAEPAGSGQFVAPAFEPTPPVVDAIEPLSVTITCTVGETPVSPPAEGPSGGTTYVYPSVGFDLELFAANDGEQPTLVDNDQVDSGGVVAATPPFTG